MNRVCEILGILIKSIDSCEDIVNELARGYGC